MKEKSNNILFIIIGTMFSLLSCKEKAIRDEWTNNGVFIHKKSYVKEKLISDYTYTTDSILIKKRSFSIKNNALYFLDSIYRNEKLYKIENRRDERLQGKVIHFDTIKDQIKSVCFYSMDTLLYCDFYRDDQKIQRDRYYDKKILSNSNFYKKTSRDFSLYGLDILKSENKVVFYIQEQEKLKRILKDTHRFMEENNYEYDYTDSFAVFQFKSKKELDDYEVAKDILNDSLKYCKKESISKKIYLQLDKLPPSKNFYYFYIFLYGRSGDHCTINFSSKFKVSKDEIEGNLY